MPIRIVLPGNAVGIEQVGHGRMVEAGKNRRYHVVVFVAALVDLKDMIHWIASATRIRRIVWILCGEVQVILLPGVPGGRRGARENELVRGIARALICLEHVIRESVLGGDIEVRRYNRAIVGRAYVGFLGVVRRLRYQSAVTVRPLRRTRDDGVTTRRFAAIAHGGLG